MGLSGNQAILAWNVESGSHHGVDLSGLKVVLCVSGAEGVMPQTREHLDILGLLGVRTGVVAVTMADLVDPELLGLCVDEIAEQVRGTFLDGAPVIATSAVTRMGLDELVRTLDAIVPPERPLDRPFRLPVDRAFARKGFGTVVTGTAWAGRRWSTRGGCSRSICATPPRTLWSAGTSCVGARWTGRATPICGCRSRTTCPTWSGWSWLGPSTTGSRRRR